jgi:hypothetical protein
MAPVVAETIERAVRRRAGDQCEYCRVPAAAYVVPFQIDHVIALQHGGATDLGNLALACYHCNLHKGPNIASIDPASGGRVALFHPRTDVWADHFEWDGARVVGRSPVGRATVRLLAMNDPDASAVREALIAEGDDFRNIQ